LTIGVLNPRTMLTFLGDVFLKVPVVIDVELPGQVVLNLESPLTQLERGFPRKINLKADPANFSKSFPTPPLAACLANNHILDFYEGGLESTLAVLRSHGVGYFGAGSQEDGHCNPLLIDVNGVRVGLLGYADRSSNAVFATSAGTRVAELTLDRVMADMASARSAGAEKVAVLAHWGYEQVPLPSVEHVRLARSIIDAGADIIIGSHSHCIQGFETYADKPIFYGLGNCVFPSHRSASHFDETGLSTRIVDSRTAPWNRNSLAVNWDPATGETKVQPLVFADGRLKAGNFSASRFEMNIESFDVYATRFNRAYRWGKFRHTVARFLTRPKLPRLRHLRGVSKDMRSAPPT